jgi:hypothetical protein
MTLIESTIETFATRLAKVGETMDLVIAAKGENVRPAVEALAEQLIAFLDATTPDPDLEEEPEGDGYADDEPSLGASDGANQERTWSLRQNSADDREHEDEDGDELDKLEASDLEISGEADGHNGGCVDDEPSLGSLDGRISQKRWGLPDSAADCWWLAADIEYDPADRRRAKASIRTNASGTTRRTALPTWTAWPSSVQNTLSLISLGIIGGGFGRPFCS